MAYTTIDDPSAYFQTTLYTGNGNATHAITHGGNSDLQSDWTWIKNRTDGHYHNLNDSVRGVNKKLRTGGTAGEVVNSSSGYLSAFASDGFTVTGGSSDMEEVNTNGDAYVSWNWKAGTSFTNDASGTGIGSIDSAGSVNEEAGFSICSFTGNGTSGASVKHGLSTKPAMMIIKNRDESDSWQVYHHKNTSAPATETLQLNETGATSDTSNRWNDTEPTTAILTLGNNTTVNKNTIKYIGYIFSEKQGYSKFGSYTGNGNADGTFVYLGFKPAMIIVKSATEARNWRLWDNKRSTYNLTDEILYPDLSNAEATGDSEIDMLSNGFKLRKTSDNTSGATYIYMAFAESPFVTSTGVPATAR